MKVNAPPKHKHHFRPFGFEFFTFQGRHMKLIFTYVVAVNVGLQK